MLSIKSHTSNILTSDAWNKGKLQIASARKLDPKVLIRTESCLISIAQAPLGLE